MAFYYICGGATEVEAQAALDEINNDTNWFPVIGEVNGISAPENCQTTNWCDNLSETIDGRFVFPCIPMTRLAALDVPQEEISKWISDHNVSWIDIPAEEFPIVEDIEDMIGDE